MGKLQSYKRIISSDYPEEQQKMAEMIGESVNSAVDDILYTLNNKVTLKDNVACTVRDVELTVDAGGGTGNARFSITDRTQVIGILVIQALNLTNSSIYPTGAPFISFTQLDNSILINNITGLLPGYRWRVRIVAFN